jgi:hypothetical protein
LLKFIAPLSEFSDFFGGPGVNPAKARLFEVGFSR